jgi:LacI family transcriptional regulator
VPCNQRFNAYVSACAYTLHMVTMAEVGRLAGVSVATVSHVLNGTRTVRPETAERVLAAVEQTGYTPNTVARGLARARTQSIGLALSAISNPYFMELVTAIEAAAGRAGYMLLLTNTQEDPAHELKSVQALVQRRVDGLLLAPTTGAGGSVLRYLASQSLPVVLLDRFVSAGHDEVGTENEQPTARLVEHLAQLGHQRIGMVAGFPGISTTVERVRGYRMGLLRSGLEEHEELIVEAGWRAATRAATHRLLDLTQPPTALVAGANHITVDVLHVLAERRLRVPDDVALVAFDDFDWADLHTPRLTTMAQQTRAIGERAVQLLVTRLDNPSLPARHNRFDTTFVHRESCGCHGKPDATGPAAFEAAQP